MENERIASRGEPVPVGVVLAAGASQRLADATRGHSKAIQPLGGISLVERAVATLRRAGVGRIIVVVGFEADQVSARLARAGVEIVEAANWQDGNGASVAAAEGAVGTADRFAVMCGDHVFSEGALDDLMRSPDPAVLVDTSPDRDAWGEGTRVRISSGLATEFSKQLAEPAIDCGVFVLPNEAFGEFRAAAAAGDHSLAGAVSRLAEATPLRAIPIEPAAWWQDIDTPEDLRAARSRLRRSLGKDTDGIVSRKINRPISTRITMALSPLQLSPSLLSAFTFFLGLWAAWSLSAGRSVVGALLVQAASVLDGTDGETARLHGKATSRGASVDAAFDRMVDAAVYAGLVLWAMDAPTRDLRMLVIGLAMVGWGLLAARLRDPTAVFEVPRNEEPWLIRHLGGRDTRMLILAAGALAGVPVPAFIASIVVYASAALWRVGHTFVAAGRRILDGSIGPGHAVEVAAVSATGFGDASPGRADHRGRLARAAQLVLFPAVVFASFVVVLPRIADLGDVWRLIQSLSWPAGFALAALGAWNLVTYWPVIMLSLPGLSLRQAAIACQSSTTVAMTLPAGGAVAVGVSYAMYSSWGLMPSAIASSALVTFVVGMAIKLLLPAVALAALLAQGEGVTGIAATALTGTAVAAAGAAGMVFLLRSERSTRLLAATGRWLINFARRMLRRPPVSQVESRINRFRSELGGLLHRRWALLSLSALVSQLSIFAVMLATMRIAGISGAEIGWAQALAVFASVRLATAVPIVPGNVGFAELGYIGGLLLVGGDSTEVVAAVLLFRFLTYFVQIPIGGITFVMWSRERSRRRAGVNA